MILCVLHAYNQLFSFIQLQFYVKFHHYLLFNHRVIRSNIHAYRVSIEQSQERKQTLTDNGHDQICTGHALSRIGDRAIAELEELPSFPPNGVSRSTFGASRGLLCRARPRKQ